MSINIRILREPEPNSAANGGGNGVMDDLPRGPLSKSMLEEVLAGRDAAALNKPKILAKTPPEGGQEGADGQPDDGAQPGEGGGSGGEVEETPGQEGGGQEGGGEGGAEGAPDAGEQLDETTQQHLNELAALISKGELSVGEVKRIKKLLAGKLESETALQDLRSQIADLQTKLESGQTPAAQPAEANPFANLVKNTSDLDKAKRDMYDIMEWAEDNADGGVRNGKEFTAEEVKQLRREARRALDIHLPAMGKALEGRATVEQNRTGMRNYMKTNHPEFYDRESENGRLAEQFRQDPLISARADGDVIAAALTIGMTELKRREALKKNGQGNGSGKPAGNGAGTLGTVVQRRPGALSPTPGANGTRVNPGAVKQMQTKVKTAIESGRREDFAAALEAMGPPGGSPTRHRA